MPNRQYNARAIASVAIVGVLLAILTVISLRTFLDYSRTDDQAETISIRVPNRTATAARRIPLIVVSGDSPSDRGLSISPPRHSQEKASSSGLPNLIQVDALKPAKIDPAQVTAPAASTPNLIAVVPADRATAVSPVKIGVVAPAPAGIATVALPRAPAVAAPAYITTAGATTPKSPLRIGPTAVTFTGTPPPVPVAEAAVTQVPASRLAMPGPASVLPADNGTAASKVTTTAALTPKPPVRLAPAAIGTSPAPSLPAAKIVEPAVTDVPTASMPTYYAAVPETIGGGVLRPQPTALEIALHPSLKYTVNYLGRARDDHPSESAAKVPVVSLGMDSQSAILGKAETAFIQSSPLPNSGGPPDEAPLIAENLRLEEARKFVMSLCQDQEGCLWVGCEEDAPGTGGVQRFDPSAPPLHQWVRFTTKDGLGDNNGYAMACDRKGRVWVGHLNHGVSVYNGQGWQNYEVVGGLSHPGTRSGPLGERVFAIKVCPTDGDVWISTNCGLSRYSQSRDDWSYYTRADGLPSDQSSAIAFDKDGNIYLGTQCDGIAMGNAADSYKIWRTVTGADKDPLVPAGAGLPTNLINDVIVAKDRTVYVATTTGLAWSGDRGITWQFLRGKDWADKVRGLNGGAPKDWKQIDHQTLAEDYCTCLGEDASGNIYVGHRGHPIEGINFKTLLTQSVGTGTFTQSILTDNGLEVGSYGNGVSAIGLWTPSNTRIAPASPVQLPKGATLRPQLAMTSSQPDVVAFTHEDWATQGDWVGRYGRQYARLCAAESPFDDEVASRSGYFVDDFLGHAYERGDCVRYFLTWLSSQRRNVLYDPCVGLRRQAEWDDHGESVSMSEAGPGLVLKVQVPSGAHCVSLYFTNKDGHSGWNRYRDYLITVIRQNSGVADAPSIAARSRVRDFCGGVYKQFVLPDMGTYLVTIAKQHSFNTIISGVFFDMPGLVNFNGPRESLAFSGNLIYMPPLVGQKLLRNVGLDIRRMWESWSKLTPRSGAAWSDWQRFGVLTCRWVTINDGGALAATLRWCLNLWSTGDRGDFEDQMSRSWNQFKLNNPQVFSKNDR